jgi:hypothetical protein
MMPSAYLQNTGRFSYLMNEANGENMMELSLMDLFIYTKKVMSIASTS